MLAALVRAGRTGEGEHIDASMTDGAFALLSVHLGEYFATGAVPGPEQMLLNGAYPCYNVYACADGRHLTVGALEPQFFEAFCEVVERPELAATRLEPDALPAWRDLFLTRSRDEWLAAFEGTGACVGPVNDIAEAIADPQLRHRGMVVEVEQPSARDGAPGRSSVQAARAPAAIGGPAAPARRGDASVPGGGRLLRARRSRASSPTGSLRREFHRTFGRYQRVWENRVVPDRGDER